MIIQIFVAALRDHLFLTVFWMLSARHHSWNFNTFQRIMESSATSVRHFYYHTMRTGFYQLSTFRRQVWISECWRIHQRPNRQENGWYRWEDWKARKIGPRSHSHWANLWKHRNRTFSRFRRQGIQVHYHYAKKDVQGKVDCHVLTGIHHHPYPQRGRIRQPTFPHWCCSSSEKWNPRQCHSRPVLQSWKPTCSLWADCWRDSLRYGRQENRPGCADRRNRRNCDRNCSQDPWACPNCQGCWSRPPRIHPCRTKWDWHWLLRGRRNRIRLFARNFGHQGCRLLGQVSWQGVVPDGSWAHPYWRNPLRWICRMRCPLRSRGVQGPQSSGRRQRRCSSAGRNQKLHVSS